MIPRTIYAEEHEIFREAVRKFFESEAAPYHEQWEEQGHIDRRLWLQAGELGVLCPTVPEDLGGVGGDFRYNAIVAEEGMRLGLSGLGFGLHSDIAVPYIVHHGSAAQQQRYLAPCIAGEMITAIAMTEPGTGSDLQGIKTSAKLVGDQYVINGTKTFITNGVMSDLVIVVCRTDPDPAAGSRAFSLLLVEAGTPGFTKSKTLKKVGLKAQDTAELFFEDVKVPKENLLGELGQGLIYLMQELPQERLSIALGAMAGCETALQQTIAYVKERKAFGKAIATFQNTQFKLAELDAQVSALRVYIDRCLELHIQDQLSTAEASKAKLLTTELQSKVVDECVQLHGGYGYMWEYPIARAYADNRVHRIYGGTNEIMKLIIARALFAD